MSSSETATFHDHFHDINDPRVERTRKHPLINIVFIAVCGVLSGANSFAAIEEFGLDRRTWFGGGRIATARQKPRSSRTGSVLLAGRGARRSRPGAGKRPGRLALRGGNGQFCCP